LSSPAPPELPSRDPLVLVVEDEFIIALDLELILQKHGFRVLGLAATVAQALQMLARETPDVALLDVNLKGEPVTPVAETLQARGVPFVLVSAYDRPPQLPAEILVAAPNVGKPISERYLLAALAQVLGR
jgi:two-component system, response regulator PdtaR